MPERYKNVKTVSLGEYFTPDKFRTIGDDMRHIPIGYTEFNVEIHMNYAAKNKLSFKAPWDGIIYGCARDKRILRQMLNLTADIKTAYLMDWDDKYLFFLELENQMERPVAYVPSKDVINLLEKCIRIPEQNIRKE